MNALTHLIAIGIFVLAVLGLVWLTWLYLAGLWEDWAVARLLDEVRVELAREALADREKQAERSSRARVALRLARARRA